MDIFIQATQACAVSLAMIVHMHLGAVQRKKFTESEITMGVGGWVQVSL